MGKGSSSATHFSAGNSISFVVASGVDSVDSVVGGMFLVGGVKCCACSVWMRLVGAVSVIGSLGDPTKGRGGGVEDGSLGEGVGEWVRGGMRVGVDRRGGRGALEVA